MFFFGVYDNFMAKKGILLYIIVQFLRFSNSKSWQLESVKKSAEPDDIETLKKYFLALWGSVELFRGCRKSIARNFPIRNDIDFLPIKLRKKPKFWTLKSKISM